MNWGMDWDLLEAHFDAIVEHMELKRGAWMRKVDRRLLLRTIIDVRDVYDVARLLKLAPPRIHELADEMMRHAQYRAGRPIDPHAKYPRLLPFAKRLKNARLGRDMTAKTMAWKTGLGIVSYHKIERAVSNPRLLTVIELARGLGLTVGQLVDGGLALTDPELADGAEGIRTD